MHLPAFLPVRAKQGALGVALVDGSNSREQPPALPDMSTVEAVQAASQDTAAWLHASLLHLLSHRRQQQQPVTGAPSSGEGDADAPPSSDEDVLDLGTAADASFVCCMTQVLQALRLFSFS
jgi:hypothetical protein